MAITNHERVGKALEFLKTGLGPFVERELKAKYGKDWAFEARDVLSDTRLGAGKGEALNDVAALLVVMDRRWGEAFRQVLGKAERSLVNELIEARNRWAHQEPFSGDDADRALDSTERLLSAVSAPVPKIHKGHSRWADGRPSNLVVLCVQFSDWDDHEAGLSGTGGALQKKLLEVFSLKREFFGVYAGLKSAEPTLHF